MQGVWRVIHLRAREEEVHVQGVRISQNPCSPTTRRERKRRGFLWRSRRHGHVPRAATSLTQPFSPAALCVNVSLCLHRVCAYVFVSEGHGE